MYLIKSKKIAALITLSLLCFSCEEILMERDITDSFVEILAPKEGSILTSNVVNFDWFPVDGATKYEVQVAHPDFNSTTQILHSEITEEESINLELPEGTYEWRIKAMNSAYDSKYQSANFQIKSSGEFENKNVLLLSPSDNEITNEYRKELKWESIEDASLYRIQIKIGDSLLEEKTTSLNNIIVDFPNGELSWRVRAETSSKNTFYSSRIIIVDTLSPAKPVLMSPVDGDTLTNPIVEFKWEVNSQAETTSEIDSIYIYYDASATDLVEKASSTSELYNYTFERDSTYYWKVQSFDEAGNKGEESYLNQLKVMTSD